MENMTLKRALQETNNILAGISVPMGLMQQIGVPIIRAMENLQNCISEIRDPEPKNMQPDPETEEKAIREEDL